MLIPGFIDTHIHAPQYPNIGLGYDVTLLDWLDKYTFPLEKKFADVKFAERVYETVVVRINMTLGKCHFCNLGEAGYLLEFCDWVICNMSNSAIILLLHFQKRLLENGTTTASYFATIHPESSFILAKSALKFGQRAFIGKVNMIKNSPPGYCESFDKSLATTRICINEILNLKSDLITPIMTPRFAINCDMPLMEELAKLAAEYKIPIQTHLSENTSEIQKVKEMYPDCRHYVDVYDKAGLLTEKVSKIELFVIVISFANSSVRYIILVNKQV